LPLGRSKGAAEGLRGIGGGVADAQGVEADAGAVGRDLEGPGTGAEDAGVVVGQVDEPLVAKTRLADAGERADGKVEQLMAGDAGHLLGPITAIE
jgi:hypothetical protein